MILNMGKVTPAGAGIWGERDNVPYEEVIIIK